MYDIGNIARMCALAVVRLRRGYLEVLLAPVLTDASRGDCASCAEVGRDLASLGLAALDQCHWEGSVAVLEPVCALLDRLGVVWGVYDPDGARTFGERIFAECPEEVAPEIYETLRSTLLRAPSTELHVAALDAAWLSRPTSTP